MSGSEWSAPPRRVLKLEVEIAGSDGGLEGEGVCRNSFTAVSAEKGSRIPWKEAQTGERRTKSNVELRLRRYASDKDK